MRLLSAGGLRVRGLAAEASRRGSGRAIWAVRRHKLFPGVPDFAALGQPLEVAPLPLPLSLPGHSDPYKREELPLPACCPSARLRKVLRCAALCSPLMRLVAAGGGSTPPALAPDQCHCETPPPSVTLSRGLSSTECHLCSRRFVFSSGEYRNRQCNDCGFTAER